MNESSSAAVDHGQSRRGRFERRDRALGGFGHAIDHKAVVPIVDARLPRRPAPQPHRVGTFVHVRGRHHHIGVGDFRAHALDIVEEQSDQIDLAHHQRFLSRC